MDEEQDQRLASAYGGPAPRYTSYPTSPHFHAGVDGGKTRDWLSTLRDDEPVSLYLHIPYCDTLCWFCGCHTKVTRKYAPVSSYVDSLLQEIDVVAAAAGKRLPVRWIHFGGGSPTILSADDIHRIAAALRDRFDIRGDVEFALEIDPRELTTAQIDAWAQVGVNRISVGLQDLNEQVQRAINRVQTFEETEACIEAFRARGVRDVNVDLIYGLPYQTLERVRATVAGAMALKPSRLALFGYAHVPWMKRHQSMIPEEALPNAEKRLRSAEESEQMLIDGGYIPIGLDHFAAPEDSMAKAALSGTLTRNFQGYTTDVASALIGLGASSISRSRDGYWQNVSGARDYARAVAAGDLPVARGVGLSDDDRARGKIIEDLMCFGRVDLSKVSQGLDLTEELARLDAMRADGLIDYDDDTVTMTEVGRPYVRAVCAVFDAYLAKGAARHSSVV